jgi:hypothetical protein
MRCTFRSFAVVAWVLVVSTLATADQFNGSVRNVTGLTNPGVMTITFDENVFPSNTPITDQFSSEGATFSGFLWNNTNLGQAGSTGFGGADLVGAGQMRITFATTVNAAVFAALDQDKDYTIQAYLGTTFVDSMIVNIPFNPGAGYIGFSNENFNLITITGPQQILPVTFAIDNLQFTNAPDVPPSSVPEPAGLIYVGSGVVFLMGLLRNNGQKK